MRTLLFKKLILLLLVLPLALMAHNGKPKGKYTKEKTVKKEYQVNPDALLKVKNSYGNLVITSWDGNMAIIEVHIKTNGNNEEKVQQKLDEINILFEATPSMVSATTKFNTDKNGWGWNWGGNNNVNMQIDYNIKIPVKNSVNLSNDYGNIVLDRIDGHAKIDCDYGRLEIGELRGRNNQLNFDYTSRSTINFIESGTIIADYSGFTIDKAGDLIIEADYTNSTIINMGNLNYSCDYGNIDIGEAKNVKGTGDYITAKLGTIHGDVDITADYGALKIEQLAADAGNVLISSDYTGVKLGYDANYHFNFEIKTSYGGVSGEEEFEMSISNVKNSSKYFKGHYGSPNSGKTMNVSLNYGNLNFIKIENY